MGRGCVLLVTLTGCNSILGLSPTQIDPDARLLLVPPDGTTPCGPPPDFNSWHYAPRTVGPTAVIHPTFLTSDRIVYAYQGRMFESGLDGGAVELTALELYPGEGLAGASAAPGGDLMWFSRLDGTAAGNYLATRDASGWHQQRADFGIVAFQVQPGSLGFYAGDARMVVAIQQTRDVRARLFELSSHDGMTWTRLDTLSFSDGSVSMFDPALSVDGCFVLYSVYGDANDLYVAGRGPDGVFLPPVHLDHAPNGFQPAIDPTSRRLWFNEYGGPLMEATP